MRTHIPAWSAGICLSVFLGIALWGNCIEPDFFGYLAYGRYAWENHALPTSDPFSYLPSYPAWIFHEWLTGVLAYPLYQKLGAWPLQAARYLAGFGAAWLLYAAARRRGASAGFAALGLALIFPTFHDAFPPGLARGVSSFGFALVLFACVSFEQRPSLLRYFWLPGVFLIWANLHGGFAVGLMLLFLYAGGVFLSGGNPRRFLVLVAICAAATLVNPYGLRLWQGVFQHAASPEKEIWEWYSLSRWVASFGFDKRTLAFSGLLVLFLLSVPSLWRSERTGLWICLFCALLGFFHLRHIPFFCFSFAVFMPRAMGLAASRGPGRKPAARVARMVFVAAVAFFVFAVNATYAYQKAGIAWEQGSPLALKAPSWRSSVSCSYLYPVEAADYIRDKGLQGNLLCDMTWGGFFLWKLYPGVKVAMDTRTETVFPAAVRKGYFDFYWVRPGWDRFLEAYPHDIVVVPSGTPLPGAVVRTGGWRVDYSDPLCAVLVRAEAKE
ncbi:MAG: hypothetical protein AB1921_13310 [Thermodesulfobacteriota bacterium]